MHRPAKSVAPVPVPSYLTSHQALVERLTLPHLEFAAQPGAVPIARHHAKAVLWDFGLKELIEPVELVVSEIVTNAIQASGGTDTDERMTNLVLSTVRLWLSVEDSAVLVLVWDASPSKPERQVLAPDAESGRGLLLVDALSTAWGSFEIADEPGKVVWALMSELHVGSATRQPPTQATGSWSR